MVGASPEVAFGALAAALPAAVEYAQRRAGHADPVPWTPAVVAGYCVLVLGGMELLSFLVNLLFGGWKSIPVRGRHLDELSPKDKAFVAINRLTTLAFMRAYVIGVAASCELGPLTLRNTVIALPALYAVYDLFYSLFHRALHLRAVYPWVHKHHHRQLAPSRGNTDAVNVHPFEFVMGEYNHLLAVTLVPGVHAVTAAVFIILGGVLASLNHTRHDVRVEPGVYAVNVHDVHHRVPMSNYGQYTMLWDRVMGTYIPYTEPPAKKKM